MVYVGFIHFKDLSVPIHEFYSVLKQYTHSPPKIIQRMSLILLHAKSSSFQHQDVDEVWENGSSVLLGRIFDKEKKCAISKIDFNNLSYFENIWGKYVRIESNKDGEQFRVTLDSTGQLPFFYTCFPNGDVLFSSEIEILFKIAKQKPRYDWGYLCSYVVYGSSSATQTPFENIYELPPACELKITKNERLTAPFWNPFNFDRGQQLEKRNAVDVLQNSLKPWIEPYKNVCVSLSGGLDSSSIVYCLKDIMDKEKTLTALNYFHPSVKSSHEHISARRVCEETKIKLIEVDLSDSLPFDAALKKQLFSPNKPFVGLTCLKWLQKVSGHVSDMDSSVFISGHGSDHIFMRPPSKKAISDYLIEKGFCGLKEQVRSMTRFYRDPVFSMIKENIPSLLTYLLARPLRKRSPKKTPDWIGKAFHRNVLTEFCHPIYSTLPLKIPPGKYDQIDSVYEGLASIHAEVGTANAMFYPFLYQHVVEFALSFNTFELFRDGYDRYPLRKSVSDHFKTETVWRRDKGDTTGIFQLGIKKNLKYVLEICLEGHFVRKGLVDKEGLYEKIMMISNGDIDHLWFFWHLVSVELFLQYWDEKSF